MHTQTPFAGGREAVMAPREAAVLAAIRRRATAASPRVIVSAAELAAETGLVEGEVSRALTKLWLDGRILLDQAPRATDQSVIDIVTSEEERGGKGGSVEESEQINTERTELIDKQTDQIGTICADGVGHAVPGEAVTAPAPATAEPQRDVVAQGETTRDDGHRDAPGSTPVASDEDPRVALARECADRLGAYDSLPAFLALARRYAPARLRNALDVVLALPEAGIRKSRPALFTWLVKHGT